MGDGGSSYKVEGKTHYQRNRAQYYAQVRTRKAKLAAIVRAFKERPCADCDRAYPLFVMQLDHVPEGGRKLIHPSRLANMAVF